MLTFRKIFRRSLDEGKLPEIWEMANETAIFSKGSKTKAGQKIKYLLQVSVGVY